jgi:acetyltransferase-like isoleucine patch superfamily enzyme
MALVERLNKSLLNRGRVRAMRLRGLATRALRFATLAGARDLLVGRNVALEVYGELVLGERVVLSDGCALEVGPNGRLVIGDEVFIGRHAVVRANELVEIGAHTAIAEHCTIRDHDHNLEPAKRIRETEVPSAPVRLERNVWLGAGVRVLRGSHLGEGCVVAANAVVRGAFPAGALLGGVPAKIIRLAGEPPGS